MPNTVPDTQYLEEEETNNNHPKSLQLKMCILHLLLHADFDREPDEKSRLTKKILKCSAFSSNINITSGSLFLHQIFQWLVKGGFFSTSSSFGSDFSGRGVIPALSPFGKSHLK